MKRAAPDPASDRFFTYWTTDMLPELRGEVRAILYAQGDFATLNSLCMTSRRERDDTETFYKSTGCPIKYRSALFIEVCYKHRYWPLLEWADDVYPGARVYWFAPRSQEGGEGWEETIEIAQGPALPDNSDDDI